MGAAENDKECGTLIFFCAHLKVCPKIRISTYKQVKTDVKGQVARWVGAYEVGWGSQTGRILPGKCQGLKKWLGRFGSGEKCPHELWGGH